MTGSRGAMASDYMYWAKQQRAVAFPLSRSEVPHLRMDSLPLAIADLDLDGASHPSYAPLRDRIAARYGVPADSVVAADGCSMANFLAMAALIAPGDKVLFERPAYEPMLATARFLGADVRRVDRRSEHGFALDPEAVAAAMSDDIRLIVLTNLHNPSGALTGEDALRAIGALAAHRGARVLIDEVYLDSAAPPQRTAALLGPEFVATNSLTKVYGLSGLRCGWVLAEPALAHRMTRLNDLFGVNQAHQAERLACIAFDHIDAVIGDTPAMLARNRALFDDFVASRDDLECTPARHGITAFPRWHGAGDPEWLDGLLRERFDTSIVPGKWFEAPDHFRIGFGLPTHRFEQALHRLGQGLDAAQSSSSS
jgi:aspartate/methionine/tyrosine aminotransferase